MPWDVFCKCSATLMGGMTDDPEEMDKEQERDCGGKILYCSMCGAYTDYDSWRILDEKEAKNSGKEIVQGG